MTGYLGVDRSLTGRRWIGPAPDVTRHAEALIQQTGLPSALCQTLSRLGVVAEDVQTYLEPTLRALLPDPRSLRDMERASARILQAVRARERIAIFADYDVDGGASAALLIDWLRQLDPVRVHVHPINVI